MVFPGHYLILNDFIVSHYHQGKTQYPWNGLQGSLSFTNQQLPQELTASLSTSSSPPKKNLSTTPNTLSSLLYVLPDADCLA